jgi:biopolymer transport protein TolR
MGVSLPGGGGKRGLDFEINLVPFIDLLSCLISFLLVTAVWTQLGKIDLNQPPPSQSDSETPPEQKPEARILIDTKGYYVNLPTEPAPRRIDLEGGATHRVWELEDALKKMLEANPEVKNVKLSSENDVKYRELVSVLDVCMSLGLKDLSMAEPETLREAAPMTP